ncbi:MAG: hypothetical protein PWQ06_1118 [Anaerophaga sp.]|jgi:hypothetical protein|nr:hypothetical protein [Anaerophaga sp.]
MGQQFNMMRALEKEIERLKAQETPEHVFMMLDNEKTVLMAVASTTVKSRINSYNESRILNQSELERLLPQIESGEIKITVLVDDITTDALETVE